ncbi:hypothetical protein OG422_20000 [Streptomyces sp. NBC_01525]|uniref:hypothetical protein n=1 Tax=Streptomyces sp. NBC_01525 TaxID=2903893 RepID=UPI0038707211
MASHARPNPNRLPRTLLRASLAVSAAGAALVAGGGAASAAPVTSTDTGATASALSGALLHSVAGATGPVKNLQLDPLANTSVDPLANAVGTQIADFKPIGTQLATDPVTKGGALKDLPLIGAVTRLLP